MRVKLGFYLLLLGALVAVAGCRSRTDKAEGTVVLSVRRFNGLPIRVSVNSTDLVQITEVDLTNIPKDPNGTTSDLQSIELTSFEVIYTRADTGTRVPTSRVGGLFGIVPVNGDDQIFNLDVMGLDQLRNPPLSDLLFENGGFDKETGSTVIQVNLSLRFFGKTIAGDSVASAPSAFTVEFVP